MEFSLLNLCKCLRSATFYKVFKVLTKKSKGKLAIDIPFISQVFTELYDWQYKDDLKEEVTLKF